MSSEPQPTRKYGRSAPSANPTPPWFMKPATASASPTFSTPSSSSSQGEEPDASDPFDSASVQTATSSRRPSRRSSNASFDLEEPNVTDNISPTTTPKSRNRTLPPSTSNGAVKSAVPTPKTAVRRSRADPFAFDAGEAPADPPSKRFRKAVAIPDSLIAPAPPPAARQSQPLSAPATEQLRGPETLNAPVDVSPPVPKHVQKPSPPPAPAIAKPTLPLSLRLEPISTADADAFALDLPPPLPTHSSSTAAATPSTSRPPQSQHAPPPRVVIPRSESQLLGNFFDSDEDDPPPAPEPILVVRPPKRKASMDVVSAPPNKKLASAGSGVIDADPFADPFDSQASVGTPVEIRTLHEMREAGENRRITEEAEFLAQGLDPTQPLTLRQYSALDLLRKLSKPAQRRKLASNSSLALLLAALSGDSDPIIMLCFLLTVHAILEDHDIHHVAVASLALDKHLFQPHFTSALSCTTSPSLPTPTSKQSRVMLSDLHTLADSLSIPPDMLTARLLWIANVHKLVHLAPTTVAGAIGAAHVSTLIQSTLAHGLHLSEWTSAVYLAHTLGLLDQLSFVSTLVASAFTCDPAGIVAVARFAVHAHGVLECQVTGQEQGEWASDEWKVDEADLAAAVLTTLRVVINVTHAEPKVIETLVAAEGGEVVRGLVQVGLTMLTGALSVDPVWVAAHRNSASGASGGGVVSVAGVVGGGGYSHSSQPQSMGADMDAIASLSDRSNPKLVAVGLLLNLAEGAPEAVGKALAGLHVESLVGVVESGSSVDQEHNEPPAHTQSMATGVISAFAAVVLATALVQADATAREKVRTRFACATWGGLRRALERFVEYQQVEDDEAGAGRMSQEVVKEAGKLSNGHWLLRQVNEWL